MQQNWGAALERLLAARNRRRPTRSSQAVRDYIGVISGQINHTNEQTKEASDAGRLNGVDSRRDSRGGGCGCFGAGRNLRIGTWHLNVAKSHIVRDLRQESGSDDRGGGSGREGDERIGVRDRRKTVSVYTANYDGKPYPITGSEIADTVTLKRVDANTSERTDTKGGKAVQTLIRVVSKDGKTMTVTIKGTNAQGQAVNNAVVFEKH